MELRDLSRLSGTTGSLRSPKAPHFVVLWRYGRCNQILQSCIPLLSQYLLLEVSAASTFGLRSQVRLVSLGSMLRIHSVFLYISRLLPVHWTSCSHLCKLHTS